LKSSLSHPSWVEALLTVGDFFSMRQIKIILMVLLMAVTSIVVAEDKLSHDKTQAYQFIKWLDEVKQMDQLSSNDISHFFAPTFKYYVNGKLVAVDAKSLSLHKFAKVHLPLRDVVIDGNKVAASYGKEKNNSHIILITFDESGKIAELSQST